MMRVVVNGVSREFPAAISVTGLVAALELAGKRIAIEHNGQIVPRSRYADTALADGDSLEVVVAVGGG